jgi:predicted dinucleotide-binding enzyme
MKIAIIGAGNIGGTLTRLLTRRGHEVRVANSRGPETLADLARETGAVPATVTEAVRGADIVVVTIPEKNIPQLPAGFLNEAPADAVIIDTGNYYPKNRDGYIADIEAGLPESRWVERHLGRPVIKAFNSIWYKNLLEKGRPSGSPDRLALPVAGDDPDQKAVVMRLIDELGFDAVDAGGLDESWRQQPGSPCYVKELNADELRQALAEAKPERPPEFRA